MPTLIAVLTVAGAYLVGGIPFGYLVGRWRGIDIFQHGSGNIGATNVGRVLGRRYGILVFVLDFAKGAGSVTVALWLEPATAMHGLGVWAGLAAFLGHLFPIYLRFHGGKGVATGAGVVCVLAPAAALGAFATWLAVVCATRYVSLASLVAVTALCVLHLGLSADPFTDGDLIITVFCLVAAGLVFYRHRANVVRLLKGTENRLPETPAMFQLGKTVHVLALALWFGSAVYFLLIVAPALFQSFNDLGEGKRPAWFPITPEFARHDAAINGPREQGSRLAGTAVAALFPWFFLLQGACGILATATSLSWSKKSLPHKVHRLRTAVLLLALIMVLIGWPLERKVADLRVPRNSATDVYLASSATTAETSRAAMKEARDEFAHWHLASLGLSMVTLLLVTVATALAAHLPENEPSEPRA